MEGTPTSEKAQALQCEVPERAHCLCAEALDRFANEEASVHSPAYVCNMVDSTMIPMVECLVRTYADGVLMNPFVFF